MLKSKYYLDAEVDNLRYYIERRRGNESKYKELELMVPR